MTQNSSKGLSVGKFDGALSCVKTFFGGADASALPDRTAKPRYMSSAFFAWKNHSRATARAGDSLLRYGAAERPGKDKKHRVDCSLMSTNESWRFDVFHLEVDIRTVTDWYHGDLQERRYERVVIGNVRNRNSVGLFALNNHYVETPSSKAAFAVHSTS